MAEFGPVGGGVEAVNGPAPLIVKTQSAHGLVDGDRVSIGMPDEAIPMCFAKCTGLPANAFAAYATLDFAFPAAFPSPTAGTPIVKLAAEDWAVVAGINWYPHFAPLQGPVRDATRFAQWLRSQAYVPDDQIKLVLSPDRHIGDAEPTLDVVKRHFEDLVREASQKDYHRLGRRLYIFLSGHGITPTRSGAPNYYETALLMANADSIFLGDHLAGFAYAEWFRALGVFDEVVLFVDCCRDQQNAVALTPPSMPPWNPQRPSAHHFYAAATQLASYSWEKPLGQPPEVSGVFSCVLMQALNSQSLCGPDGVLTGKILKAQLNRDVPALQNQQQPDIDFNEDEDIAFVKRLNPQIPEASITFSAPDLRGKTAQLLGKKYPNPDAIHIIDQGAWVVPLEPFNYSLKVPGTPYPTKFFEFDGNQKVLDVQFP